MNKRSFASASSLFIVLALLFSACSGSSPGVADKIINRDKKTPSNLSGSWEGELVYYSLGSIGDEYDTEAFKNAADADNAYYCSLDISVEDGDGTGSFLTYAFDRSYTMSATPIKCTYKDGKLSGEGSASDFDIGLSTSVDKKTGQISGDVTFSAPGYEVVYTLRLFVGSMPRELNTLDEPPVLPGLTLEADSELYDGAWTGFLNLSGVYGDAKGLKADTQYECTLEVNLAGGLATATVGGRTDILTDLYVYLGGDELMLEGLFCGHPFDMGMSYYEIAGGNIFGFTFVSGDSDYDFDFDIDVYRTDLLGPYSVSSWSDYLTGFWVNNGIDYSGGRTLAYNFDADGTVRMIYVYFDYEDNDTNYWDVEYAAEGSWSVDDYRLTVSWYDVDYSVVSAAQDISAHMYTYDDAFEAPMLGDGEILYFECLGYLDLG